MSKRPIRIVHLYARDMNIYGDWGNVLALKRRLQWHGYAPEVVDYNPGDEFPENIDIVVGGGGQDNGQDRVQADLQRIGPKLIELARADTPMLVVCGLYQLFGHRFVTSDGREIAGIGLFDLETKAGPERLIGNIISHSEYFGTLVGYENHSGLTTLGSGLEPLGKVLRGAGNNNVDETEGALHRNVVGTYLHGSLLPKNPELADFLIERAVVKRYGEFVPQVIDEQFSEKARDVAIRRPR